MYEANRLVAVCFLAVLIASGLILVHATALLLHRIRGINTSEVFSSPDNLILITWTILTALGTLSWPNGFWLDTHPLAFLLLFGTIAAFPCALVEGRETVIGYRLAHYYLKTLLILGLTSGAASAVGYALALRSFIESIDFYMVICFARDIAHGVSDVPLQRYNYFPGVYRFWAVAILIFGQKLSHLQWVYVAVLILNAGLIGGIVYRTSKCFPAAMFGGIWYLVICSRLEGFFGLIEPIGTVPFLMALLVWSGMPLRGRTGAKRAMALGIGIGLAAYTKQQCGLLALGIFALLPNLWIARSELRHHSGCLAAVPASAFVVFCIAIAAEKAGWAPLRIGLAMVQDQPISGSFTENLRGMTLYDQTAVFFSGISLIFWVVLHLVPRFRAAAAQPWAALAGFLTLSALASLLQYRWLPHKHYALLVFPLATAASLILSVRVVGYFPERLRTQPLARVMFVGLFVLPCLWGMKPGELKVWKPFSWGGATPLDHWRKNPGIESDIKSLKSLIKEGEEMLILPPRRNEIHLLVGTRATVGAGYRFVVGINLDAIDWDRLDAVLVLKYLTNDDQVNWDTHRCSEKAAQLSQLGFQQAADLGTMTLWRRGS